MNEKRKARILKRVNQVMHKKDGATPSGRNRLMVIAWMLELPIAQHQLSS